MVHRFSQIHKSRNAGLGGRERANKTNERDETDCAQTAVRVIIKYINHHNRESRVYFSTAKETTIQMRYGSDGENFRCLAHQMRTDGVTAKRTRMFLTATVRYVF